jgi:hypothetical protein
MRGGAICVAGIDPETNLHVRPMTPAYQRLDRTALRENGGPFGVGAVVDLGRVADVGAPPEVEDRQIDLRYIRLLKSWPAPQFWSLLTRCSKRTPHEVFGPALRPVRRGAACEMGEGAASLGLIVPPERPKLYASEHETLRLTLPCEGAALDLSVTDIRFYDEQDRLRPEIVADALARLGSGVPLILALGLTRPYTPRPEDPRRHWLQINGLHFEDHLF